MTYDTIFSRSFSSHEQRKFGCGAFIGCFMIALCFCTVFKPYLGPLPLLKLRLSMGVGVKMLMTDEEKRNPQKLYIEMKESKPICNFSELPRSDVCEMNGDVRIHGNSSTIFFASSSSPTHILVGNSSWSLRPYARKADKTAMSYVRNFTIKPATPPLIPRCTKNHSVAAVVFSLGGYTGNHFHDFSDIVIPLYITSRGFNGEVQFLISDKKSWWIKKYRAILQKLSKYDIINIDDEDGIHCFPSLIVGLKGHKELSIDPSKSPYSMKEFRQFLRASYSLKRQTATKLRNNYAKKPRLLIISRKKTRAFTNEGEIVNTARSLGYDVVVTEADSNLGRFSHVVNSCDVIMGVHGAGLTNVLFIPENGVLIQVVPLGEMEWIARTDFEEPAKDMELGYLEYKISEGESTLIEQYPLDHEVFRDSHAISEKGWGAFKEVYLVKQNVKIDVSRFRATLLEAIQLLRVQSL